MSKRELILGIDLGTTCSLACIQDNNGRFHYFSPRGDGHYLMPSVFLHAGKDRFIIGEEAENEMNTKSGKHVVRHAKRKMKHNFSTSSGQPYRYESNGKQFSPAKVSGEILRALKQAAERSFRNAEPGSFHEQFDFEGQIYRAVITVPAYFGPQERDATREAAKIAGFARVELLDEPVSAAIGMRLHEKAGQRIALVIDVGGGTCDITVLKVGKNVAHGGFEELGRIGDNEVGGINFDREIAQRTLYHDTPAGYNDTELGDFLDGANHGLLYKNSERAKIYLCDSFKNKSKSNVSSHVSWREVTKNKNFTADVSLQWFLEKTNGLIEYVARLCDFLLSNIDRKEAGLRGRRAGIRWREIDSIYMVGGGALMPQLQERIAKRWKSEKELTIARRPQWVVAEGAAVYADMIGRNKALPGIAMPRCPYDIGVMCQAQPTYWKRLANKFLGGSNTDDAPPLKFSALIKSNSLLGETDRVQTYSAQISDQDAQSVSFPICQRFVAVNTDSEEDDSFEDDDEGNQWVNYQIRTLQDVVIKNLPPGRDPNKDCITIEIRYDANHTMKFLAWHDGRQLTPITIKRDTLDRFSEQVWDASS